MEIFLLLFVIINRLNLAQVYGNLTFSKPFLAQVMQVRLVFMEIFRVPTVFSKLTFLSPSYANWESFIFKECLTD